MKKKYALMMGGGFDQQGKYTYQQLDDLINIDGYIPVATASELDALRNTVLQEMGVGTPWEGDYLTGDDKKYIQIYNIDFNNGSFLQVAGNFVGIYDGNLTSITNISISGTGMFNMQGTTGDRILRNMIVSGQNHSLLQHTSILVSQTVAGVLIEDCVVSGTVQSEGNASGGDRGAGLVGQNYGTIKRCISHVDVSGVYYSCGSLVGNNRAGGIIEDCYSTGSVSASLSNNVGGLVGNNFGGAITNCYSIGSANYGLVWANSGTITNSYWNTDIVAASNGGTGKTTTEMQQGLIPDTLIYVGWSPSVWDSVDNTSYPQLISLQ